MRQTVRVLPAEDDQDHAFLTIRALRDQQGVTLEIEAVNDGVEAMDYLHRRGEYADRPRPDLILLDLKMPRLDGFEVLEQLKTDPELHSIPVIVLSSSDLEQDVRRSYGLGSNSYVVKPFGSSDLFDTVRAIPDYWASVNRLPTNVNG